MRVPPIHICPSHKSDFAVNLFSLSFLSLSTKPINHETIEYQNIFGTKWYTNFDGCFNMINVDTKHEPNIEICSVYVRQVNSKRTYCTNCSTRTTLLKSRKKDLEEKTRGFNTSLRKTRNWN